jgi:hypothetical protein
MEQEKKRKTLFELHLRLQKRGTELCDSYKARERGKYENGKANGRRKVQNLMRESTKQYLLNVTYDLM